MSLALRSPISRRALAAYCPHALSDGAGERWPVVDGVPYLRAGSTALAQAALERLDGGDRESALALLLAENDAWWDEPPPPETELRAVVRDADALSLREVMRRLGWGRVGDYFAHRWSDPTFVAGQALTDAHWTRPATAFELACGVGGHLRALALAGVRAAGGDVVFAKLWVARHWVVGPKVELVCFDAEAPWPLVTTFDLVACHDAFYFLRDKAAVATALKAAAGEGALLLSHVHNARWPNLSGGRAMEGEALGELFPDAVVYDDAELTRAGAEGRTPRSAGWAKLAQVEAFSLAAGAAAMTEARPATGPVSRPPEGAALVRNPLLTSAGVRWPSARYREEYGPRATYGRISAPLPAHARMDAQSAPLAARRDLVDLPERW